MAKIKSKGLLLIGIGGLIMAISILFGQIFLLFPAIVAISLLCLSMAFEIAGLIFAIKESRKK